MQALLGLPATFAIAPMLPIGHPVKQLRRLRRKPVSSFAWIDRFGGTPLLARDDDPGGA